MLRSNGEFERYALSVVVQKIQQLEETGQTDGPDGQNTEKTFRFLCDMTRWKSLINNIKHLVCSGCGFLYSARIVN